MTALSRRLPFSPQVRRSDRHPRSAAGSGSARPPILDAETERHLIARWRDHRDREAADQLLRTYRRLVLKIASQYVKYGTPIADLVSEGNLGLLRAIDRFDPSRGVRLSTYAVWWIRSAIGGHALDSISIVKVITSESHKRVFFNLHRIKARLGVAEAGEMQPETVAAIARALDVSEADVIRVSRLMSARDLSLNGPAGGGDDPGLERQERLADPDQDQEAALVRADESRKRKALVDEAMTSLSPRERHVLYERMARDKPTSLARLGDEFGISRERVRQIEARALDKLRKRLRNAALAQGLWPSAAD